MGKSNAKVTGYFVVYTGRRLVNGKVFQSFIQTNTQKERLFQGVRGVHMGHTYHCGAKSIATRPETVKGTHYISNPEWEAADVLVDEHNARKRANATMAKSSKPHLKAAIEALRPLVSGLDYFGREKLIRFLAEKTKDKKVKF